MGEVDQLNDPVYEGVANRDQGPDGTVGQALDEVEAEQRKVVVDDLMAVHVVGVTVCEVADPVVSGQRDQSNDQAPGPDMLAQ